MRPAGYIVRFALGAALFTAIGAIVASGSFAQMPPAEKVGVRELPAASPHWAFVYLGIASFPSDYPSVTMIIDGDSRKALGSIDGGFMSTVAIAPNHREFYSIDTFYSRGSRGVRTDVASIYDLKTLMPTGEVIIPPKRQLAAPDNISSAVTPDGRFLLAMNMTPATSVSVVDLKRPKFMGEIELPGCTEVLVTGDRRFVSLCADGSLLTTAFDDNGKIKDRARARPFFNVGKDLVFATPGMIGNQAWFVSYHAKVYPVDLGKMPAEAGHSWPLLSTDDAAQKWLPGGFQELSIYPAKRELYVLMHQGGEWSHKDSGNQVWVYDLATHQRTRKIILKRAAQAIRVTTDDHPLLFAVCPSEDAEKPADGSIGIYSASDGKFEGSLDGFLLFWPQIYGF